MLRPTAASCLSQAFLAALLTAILAACDGLVAPPAPTLSPLEIRGRSVFDAYCSRCHGASGDTVIVGPSLAGIATRGGGRVAGQDAEAYIRDSILDPGAYTVEGFPKDMMPRDLKEQIPPADLDALVAYLLTLR
jgi:mono/diheme cytochrome c family protein